MKNIVIKLFKIYRQILNFANQASASSEIQYLVYNQRKSTFVKFPEFVVAVIIYIFLQGLHHKETPFPYRSKLGN